jgi:precorrin-6A/cobalt-precorrin-6A reductase
MVEGLGRRVLLAAGRQDVAAFAAIDSAWFLIRAISAPDPPLPPDHELLLDRGPFTLQNELDLVDRHGIDLIVTKDSGGTGAAPKLEAARARDLPVIIVDRPPVPPATTVHDVEAALAWLA